MMSLLYRYMLMMCLVYWTTLPMGFAAKIEDIRINNIRVDHLAEFVNAPALVSSIKTLAYQRVAESFPEITFLSDENLKNVRLNFTYGSAIVVSDSHQRHAEIRKSHVNDPLFLIPKSVLVPILHVGQNPGVILTGESEIPYTYPNPTYKQSMLPIHGYEYVVRTGGTRYGEPGPVYRTPITLYEATQPTHVTQNLTLMNVVLNSSHSLHEEPQIINKIKTITVPPESLVYQSKDIGVDTNGKLIPSLLIPLESLVSYKKTAADLQLDPTAEWAYIQKQVTKRLAFTSLKELKFLNLLLQDTRVFGKVLNIEAQNAQSKCDDLLNVSKLTTFSHRL